MPVQDFLFVNPSSRLSFILFEFVVVLALLPNSHILRSTDSMLTWETVNLATYGTSVVQMSRSRAGITLFSYDSLDPNLVFLFGSGNYSWISEDSGATFHVVLMDIKLEGFLPHPTQRSWMIAYMSSTKSLYISKNLANWRYGILLLPNLFYLAFFDQISKDTGFVVKRSV